MTMNHEMKQKKVLLICYKIYKNGLCYDVYTYT